jgi:hypothetical protein
MVIAALAVIALVAFVALFIFGGSSEGSPTASPTDYSEGVVAGRSGPEK